MIDVVTFGETMVSLRSAGPLTVHGTLTARIAGAESTVAIDLARLATRSAGCTKVAAFCVSTAGDYEGLPTRAELDDLQLSEVVTLR